MKAWKTLQTSVGKICMTKNSEALQAFQLRSYVDDINSLVELKASCEGSTAEPMLFLFLTIQYWRSAVSTKEKIRLFRHMHKQLNDGEKPITIDYNVSVQWDDVAQLLDIDSDGLWYTDEKVMEIVDELELQLVPTLHRVLNEHKCLSAPSTNRAEPKSGPLNSPPSLSPTPPESTNLRRVQSHSILGKKNSLIRVKSLFKMK
jgi:hypothetical protein